MIKSLLVFVLFGYIDQRPSKDVVDKQEMDFMFGQLIQPCENENSHGCGYEVVNDNGHDVELVKEGNHVLISRSSYTEDDDLNRGQFSREQNARSFEQMQLMKEALETGDQVIYIGHARYGFGPDFGFPILHSHDRIDVDFYRKHLLEGFEPFESELSHFKGSKLALFSCDSLQHFQDYLRQKLGPLVELVLPPQVLLPRENTQAALELL